MKNEETPKEPIMPSEGSPENKAEKLRGGIVGISTGSLPDALYVKIRTPKMGDVWAVDFQNSLGFVDDDTREGFASSLEKFGEKFSAKQIEIEELPKNGPKQAWSVNYRVVSDIPTADNDPQYKGETKSAIDFFGR